MKAMDPSVQVVAVGAVGRWSETMLAEASNDMDLISEHSPSGTRPAFSATSTKCPRRSGGSPRPSELGRRSDVKMKRRSRIRRRAGTDLDGLIDGEIGNEVSRRTRLASLAAFNEYARQMDSISWPTMPYWNCNATGKLSKTSKTVVVLDSMGVYLALYRKRFRTIRLQRRRPSPALDDAQHGPPKDEAKNAL